MDSGLLIDVLVRKTAHLVADLAVHSPTPAPLGHVSDLFFAAIDERLRTVHQRPQRVVADILGLPIRTYQYRVASVSEASTLRGATVWAAIYRFVRAEEQATRADIETRFVREPPELVGSILGEMVRSKLLFCAGRGPSAVYLVNPRISFDPEASAEGDARLVWVISHGRPASTLLELGASLGVEPAGERWSRLERAVNRLVDQGALLGEADASGEVRYRSLDYVLPRDVPEAQMAAICDHVSVVLDALGQSLIPQDEAPRLMATGATYRFDLHSGTPESEEVEDLVDALRARCSHLRTVLETSGPSQERLVFYFGQMLQAEGDGGRPQ